MDGPVFYLIGTYPNIVWLEKHTHGHTDLILQLTDGRVNAYKWLLKWLLNWLTDWLIDCLVDGQTSVSCCKENKGTEWWSCNFYFITDIVIFITDTVIFLFIFLLTEHRHFYSVNRQSYNAVVHVQFMNSSTDNSVGFVQSIVHRPTPLTSTDHLQKNKCSPSVHRTQAKLLTEQREWVNSTQ